MITAKNKSSSENYMQQQIEYHTQQLSKMPIKLKLPLLLSLINDVANSDRGEIPYSIQMTLKEAFKNAAAKIPNTNR